MMGQENKHSGLVILQNGIRLYTDYIHGLKSIAISVSINVGARDEIESQNGIAHFLEHMVFKGTNKRSAKQLAEEIESVGGWLNASTEYQRTTYYARALSKDTELCLDLLADMLFNSSFDEIEIQKERQVICQEIGEAYDNPEDHVYTNLQAACFNGQSLGRPILGTQTSLSKINKACLTDFLHKYYIPENIVICVAGDIDPETLAVSIERTFGGATCCETEKVMPRGLPERALAKRTVGTRFDQRNCEQTHIAIAAPGVASRSKQRYVSDLFCEILGGGMASRLFQSIRETRSLAYSVYSFSENYDDTGLVDIYAASDPQSAPLTIGAIRDEIEAMSHSVAIDELKRAKATLKSSALMALETPLGRIDKASHQLFAEGSTFSPDYIADAIDRVSLVEVKNFADFVLSEPWSLSVVGSVDEIAATKALGFATDGPACSLDKKENEA
ncbi:MAG: pitrilysin family protein [Pseudomonadota bacterium]